MSVNYKFQYMAIPSLSFLKVEQNIFIHCFISAHTKILSTFRRVMLKGSRTSELEKTCLLVQLAFQENAFGAIVIKCCT